jgi:tryptophan-rich sensory protein
VALMPANVGTSLRNYLSLAIFLVVVVGGGLLIGFVTLPGEWYASLAKPPFNPPNWVFAPVWTVLYVLIAVAGWRAWERDAHGAAMKLWGAQLILNFAWSPVFFGAQKPALGLVVIVALLATIVWFIRAVRRSDGFAAGLFVPYALWVAFATLLNASIVVLN